VPTIPPEEVRKLFLASKMCWPSRSTGCGTDWCLAV